MAPRYNRPPSGPMPTPTPSPSLPSDSAVHPTGSGSTPETPPFQVLGVALVVEEPGRGARLIFRYPASPPPVVVAAAASAPAGESGVSGPSHPPTSRSASLGETSRPSAATTAPPPRPSGGGENGGQAVPPPLATTMPSYHPLHPPIPPPPHKNNHRLPPPSCDLFFTLPSRVMAKLFRPKPPLCGQPMTLTVGGTIFCCRAVLMPGSFGGGVGGTDQAHAPPQQQSREEEDGSATPSAAAQESLVLFSVIVALAPAQDFGRKSRVDRRGYGHGSASDVPARQFSQRRYSPSSSNGHARQWSSGERGGVAMSASGLAVRRIHLSLSRLCRALEREERRCGYASRQASLMVRVKAEAFPSGGGDDDVKKSRFARASSGGEGGSSESTNGAGPSGRAAADTESDQRRREEELSQALIELMLAAKGPADNGDNRAYCGSLARELAQTFHALSRNDVNFLMTPSILMGDRNGIVYVNGHVAVPIEPASGHLRAAGNEISMGVAVPHPESIIDRPSIDYLRPYHTLLFPHASPTDLLQITSNPQASTLLHAASKLPFASLNFSPFHHSQRLQRLLLMASPTKSIADISVDAALPLPLTLELASYLVDSGTCVASQVVSRSTRFALNHGGVGKMQSLSLPFAQRFGPAVPIFLAAATLTSGSTLGEAMELAADGTDSGGAGHRIAASLLASTGVGGMGRFDDGADIARHPPQMLQHHSESKAIGGIDLGGRRIGRGGPTGRTRSGSLGEDVSRNLPTPPRSGGHRMSSAISGSTTDSSVENILFDMALWQRSHGVIVEVREYATSINPSGTNMPPLDPDSENGGRAKAEVNEFEQSGNSMPSSTVSAPSSATNYEVAAKAQYQQSCRDEAIYQELLDAGCLNGNVSTTALCWKFGLELRQMQRLREWGRRTRQLEFVTRIPAPGDDWGAP